ncbi:uncharacterized protein C3orf38 homolog isoform X2 [Cylas formicarius]|uniref:uncharacterized protein C3orf38 homolog isoform X2 n=1 Tax=Cylas formicarius TaxID=197179 RepID=UPI0029589F6C|nr:uncharacterized protein C3orf38 homolog isoform X2 [Cylas formicarius]
MNPKEQIVAVLSKLSPHDVHALARTITQGLKKCRNKEEAIQCIIKYSSDEISILRRRTVTRDILFSYLEECGIKVRLPTTKNDLIDRIAELWNIPRTSNSSENNNSDVASREVVSIGDINVMAQQFADWFYSMLNENDLGSEHLFEVNIFANNECDTTVLENNPQEVTSLLLQTRLKHNLHFNPNISDEGVHGRTDPHGLVVVLVCGTLHVSNICAGVFEQVFTLAKDPFSQNTWKIKSTELNLRRQNEVPRLPTLCEGTMDLLPLTEPTE